MIFVGLKNILPPRQMIKSLLWKEWYRQWDSNSYLLYSSKRSDPLAKMIKAIWESILISDIAWDSNRLSKILPETTTLWNEICIGLKRKSHINLLVIIGKDKTYFKKQKSSVFKKTSDFFFLRWKRNCILLHYVLKYLNIYFLYILSRS